MAIYRKVSSSSTFWTDRSKDGYVQKPPPYVRPTAYTAIYSIHMVSDSKYPITYRPTNWANGVASALEDPWASAQRMAYAKAYDSVIRSIRGSTTASVGATVAERRESFEMIARRSSQILEAYKAFRTGNIRSGLRHMGFRFRSRRGKPQVWVRVGKGGKQYTIPASKPLLAEAQFKKGLKTPSSLWLEYWFGWAPLVDDIYSAVQVTANPIKPTTHRNVFRGHGKAEVTTRSYKSGKTFISTQYRYGSFGVHCVCTVKEVSPNLAMLNRLGLVNPVSIAWELVPFSWLVDWFVPVGRYLESFTDSVGFSITQPTSSYKSHAIYRDYNHVGIGDPGTDRTVTGSGTSVQLRRSLDAFTQPPLTSRKGSGISSLSRAATSVAILVGFLKRS